MSGPQGERSPLESDTKSSFSTTSRYVDALEEPNFDLQTPQIVLEQQLSLLRDGNGTCSSKFVYGTKPPWGWDYAMTFKLPTLLEEKCAKESGKDNLDAAASGHGPSPDRDDPEGAVREKRIQEKDEEIVQKRVDILARLKAAGFVFSQLLLPSEGIILLRLSLPEKRMKLKAVNIGMELRLKEDYGGGYASFSPDREAYFVNDPERMARNSYFSPADRSIIILSVLQSKEDWGCALNIESLLHKKTVLQAFAIHSMPQQQQLIQRAVWQRIWDPTYIPPFQELKDYVGARVAFYFVFVNFYARSLLYIAVVSIPVYTVYRVLTNTRAISIVYWVFSVGLAIWTTVFLECWKRRNAEVNLQWGLDDYHDDTADDTRVQFVGELRYGFYCAGGFVALDDVAADTHDESKRAVKLEEGQDDYVNNVSNIPRNPYHNPRAGQRALLTSAAVTCFFVLLVGGLTFLLLWFRNEIIDFFEARLNQKGFARAIPGILNGILVTVFDSVWRTVSLTLTRRENHRTNQKFENSLVYKRFAFQFVSNYVSLFFIAFVRPFLNNTCRPGYLSDEPDCMVELENQLMSLLITKATIGQITEIGIPFITSTIKQWRARSRSTAATPSPTDDTPQQSKIASSGHTRYVAECKLANYDSTMEDYGELVLQFGYVVLFGLAFPPAAVVALLNNLIEGRTDAYKILALSQRVSADDAADIGAWYLILEFLNVLAAATNAGLVVFTADAPGVLFGFGRRILEDTWQHILYRVIAFFLMEHFLLGVKAAAAFAISDVPGKVKRAAARRGYDVARVLGEGWKQAYRGGGLLEVDEREVGLCGRFAEVFEVASDDGDERLK